MKKKKKKKTPLQFQRTCRAGLIEAQRTKPEIKDNKMLEDIAANHQTLLIKIL